MAKKSDFYIALKWITDILNRLEIPYQIVGGLAAKCYGSSRPLYDIDFYIPSKGISKLEEELTEYIEFGPERHKDEKWDLVFMKLKYDSQQIEFGDAGNAQYFDSHSQQWIKEEINFSDSTILEFEGIKLPVMPKEALVTYKQRLNRRVDRIDIKEIQNQGLKQFN